MASIRVGMKVKDLPDLGTISPLASPPTTLFIAPSVPSIPGSLLFLASARPISTSEPLCLLFHLPGGIFLQILATWLSTSLSLAFVQIAPSRGGLFGPRRLTLNYHPPDPSHSPPLTHLPYGASTSSDFIFPSVLAPSLLVSDRCCNKLP